MAEATPNTGSDETVTVQEPIASRDEAVGVPEGESLDGTLLARNVTYNLIGQGAPLLAALFAIPLLDGGLGTARYGLLLIAWMLIGYFSLFDLGLGRALTHLVADKLGTDQRGQVPGLVWTAIALATGLGLAGALLIAVIAPALGDLMMADLPLAIRADGVRATYVLAATIPFVVLTACLRGILAARQRFDVINALRIPMGLFTFVGPLLVLPFAPTLFAVLLVLLAGRVVAWVAHAWFCLRELPDLADAPVVRRRLIRPLFRFGGWMTVSNVVSPVMVYLDRLLIGVVLAATAVAYYATPWEVVTKLLVIPTALAGVVFPSFSYWNKRGARQVSRLFFTSVKLIGVTLFPLCLLLIAGAHAGLDLWMGAEYAEQGAVPMQLLTIGVLLNGLASVPFALIQGVGRPDVTAKLHLIELPLYCVLLFWLIGELGLVGVALAWLVRVAVDLILLMMMSRSYVPDAPGEFRRIGVGLAAASGLMVVVFMQSTAAAGLVVALSGIVCCGLGAWKFLFDAREIDFLAGLTRNLVAKLRA